MIVHQAFYGEDTSHGHGLLHHSPMTNTERVPFAEAARRTDLVSNPPSGTIWTPYLRSFVEGGYYVLSRTFPDDKANRRGMVNTHAVFLPLAEFCSTGHLSQAIELLQKQLSYADIELPIDLLSISHSEAVPSFASSLEDQRYQAFIDALVNEYAKPPIVWVGQEHFDLALAQLWEFLTPELRRAFTFRISFSPRDVEDMPPPVVCTPESLASHWPPPYRIISKHSTVQVISSSMAYLLGGTEEKAIRELQNQLGFTVINFSSLRDLARIYTNTQEVKKQRGVEPLDASLRLIAKPCVPQ